MKLFSSLLDLLYPPRCVFCRRFMDGGKGLVCPACRDALPFTGRGEETHGDFFLRCVAPLYYENQVRDSLLRYKFSGKACYAPAYGALLADRVRDALAGEYDLISWVPLSRRRLRERGYDQARLLARALAAELGTSAVPTLRKARHTPRQSTAGAAEKRRANIADAYRVLAPETVAGKRVLLVDDIVTTGATLSECARTLRAAGAEAVVCAAVARTRG